MIPIRGSTLRIDLIGIFLLATPLFMAQVAAQTGTYTDGFEDDTVGQNPSADWYTYTEGGTGSQTVAVSSSQAYAGSNSLIINELGTSQTLFKNPIFTMDAEVRPLPAQPVCSTGTPQGDLGISFEFRLDALPTAGSYFMGFDQGGEILSTVHHFGMLIDTAGAVTLQGRTTTGINSASVQDLVIAPDTWYPVEFGGFDCRASSEHMSVFFPDQATGTEVGPITGTMAAYSDWKFTRTATGIWPDWWIDDFTVTGGAETGIGVRFCANPLEHDPEGDASSDNPNYGYTYRRGGTYFDQGEPGGEVTGIGLSTGFEYGGTSSESSWDYSAKQFTTGSEAMHANITIEAGTDASSSVFRVNFATVSGAAPSATTKGNGLDTQNFANHAEAQFTENGDRWQIQLYYVTGGGTRTQLGPAVNHGSANDARSYSVWSDNRGATPWIAVKDSAGATVITSNSTTPGTLATFQSAFSGDEIFDIWYVGYGTGLFTANTALDNNEAEAGNSTCMFDDVGTAVADGSAGTSPADLVPPDVDPDPSDECAALVCPPAEGIGGLSSEALSLFLGIVLIASFAASMNEKTGAGAAGLAIFALLGVFLAYALGYIQLWVLLVLFAIGLGAIFLGLFKGSGSEGM